MTNRRQQLEESEAAMTVAESAKKLQDDMQRKGFVDGERLRAVFGDPRRGVEVQTSTAGVTAHYLRPR